MIEKYRLPNGIPVFIVENHASPVVSIQAWVARGSCHENEKVAGISHFLEHALFKGTKKRKVGEIALEIESRGGEINAFTSFEETAYYATLASRYFEEGLDVISDAIQNPSFDEDEMTREREVILEEIKRAHDSTFKMISMGLWQSCYNGTPFGRPVLGFDKTVRGISAKTLRDYHSKHYHAKTVSLVVVGDIRRDKAFKSILKKFGRMPKKSDFKIAEKISPVKNRQVKVVSIARDIQECQLQIGFPAPGVTDDSIPALDLMASALGQGESSRLYQTLVKETQLALEVQMGLSATSRCGISAITLVVAPENLQAALKKTMEILCEAAENGLREAELERVKSSLEADTVGGKETVEGYARRLGYYYIQFGDPDFEKKYLEMVLGVDVAEATTALRKMLRMKPVVSIAYPKDFSLPEAEIANILDLKELTTADHDVETGALTLRQEKTVKLVCRPVHSLPMIALRFFFAGGAREEVSSEHGLTNLFQRVWVEGTQSFNSLQIAQTLESLGASFHGFSGRHTSGISLEFLSKHWPIIKPILREVLTCPTFPSEELETEKNLVLREILAEKDSPGQLCNMNFMKAMYGKHVYGRSSLGTQETVSSITSDSLKRFFKNYIHKKNLVISTVGCFDVDHWTREILDVLSDVPETGKTPEPLKEVAPPSSFHCSLGSKEPLHQAHLLVGFLGASIRSNDRYALKLLSSCLAGQGGRLFLELRDKQSLAYQVAPIYSDSPERGVFAFYIGCSPEKWERSIQGIRTEIQKLIEKPMGAKELSRAKEYWIGRFELDMQRFSSQAMTFGLDECYGLGYQHAQKVSEIVKSISAADIQNVAQRYFDLDRVTISLVHPAPITQDMVRKAWS